MSGCPILELLNFLIGFISPLHLNHQTGQFLYYPIDVISLFKVKLYPFLSLIVPNRTKKKKKIRVYKKLLSHSEKRKCAYVKTFQLFN